MLKDTDEKFWKLERIIVRRLLKALRMKIPYRILRCRKSKHVLDVTITIPIVYNSIIFFFNYIKPTYDRHVYVTSFSIIIFNYR